MNFHFKFANSVKYQPSISNKMLQLLAYCPSTPAAVKLFDYIRPMGEVALVTNSDMKKTVMQESFFFLLINLRSQSISYNSIAAFYCYPRTSHNSRQEIHAFPKKNQKTIKRCCNNPQ